LEGVIATNFIDSGPSIRLSFSKALPASLTNTFADWLKITPGPTNLAAFVSGRSLTLRGAFAGASRYNVAVRAGFPSDETFTLPGTNITALWMPPVAPRLYFPALSQDQSAGGGRGFPLLAVNVRRARLRAKVMDWRTAIHALRGYNSYFLNGREARNAWDRGESYRMVNFNLVPGRTVFDEELEIDSPLDVAKQIDPGWDRILNGRRTAVVFLDAERAGGYPPLGTQSLIQLTDLGLVWKTGKGETSVFVFSLGSGRPVSGATARLFSDENEPLGESVTDSGGVARLVTRTNAAWVAAQLGDDFHALPLGDARAPYTFAFSSPEEQPDEDEAASDPAERRRVMLFSDRKLYRPGEDFHLEALARDWSDGGLGVPGRLTGVLKCLDARSRQFFETNAEFSPDGSWSVSVPLPRASRGWYTAQLRLGSNDYNHTFLAQDFQPDAFEVSLPSKAEFSAGEKIELPLSARYFFGKALSRARVKWSLVAEDAEFRPKGFEEYSFRRAEAGPRFRRGNSSVSLNGAGTLGGGTNFVIAPELPANSTAPGPRSVSLLAEVTDVNQQTISRRLEFVRHSSDFYLGLRQAAKVLTAGTPPKLEVLAAGTDGRPWPQSVAARLTLRSVEWQTVRVRGAGKTARYRSQEALSNVFETSLEVGPVEMPLGPAGDLTGNPVAGLPMLPSGEYLLEVNAADNGGRPVAGSLRFWVAAAAERSWSYRNDLDLALKPDRERYAPGDAAEILVEAPFSGDALVTVERERVLRSFFARLEGNAPSIRVPIETGDAPNVYVSVTLVRGSKDCPRKVKEPEYRAGYCMLTVANPANRLAVTVSPEAPAYRPGQTVAVDVQVAGGRGEGVPGAGVVLYAVDEGVINLAGYEPPDPYGFFHRPLPIGVQTGVSLPFLLTEDPEELRFQNKGYLGGGGGGSRPRKNFLACASWNARLSTDSAGKAVARFPAPDSLTRYRVFAVVYLANRFGAGQSTFEVSKPLILEPALPGFANITDRLVARGVVQNQTGRAGDVIVALKLDGRAAGATPESPLAGRVAVPARGSAVVEFPVLFTETGESKWLWEARFADPGAGDFADAVESRIEVGHIAPVLRDVLASRWTNSAANLLASANPRLLAGRGTITVHLSNTRLSELGEAEARLLQYPYGCVEQTASSLLPWILLGDAPGLAPLLGRDTNEMARAVTAGVARLFTMRTPSGGLGYWPRDKEPMLWGSAYGAMVLTLARRHGALVPKDDYDALLKYLGEELRQSGVEPADFPGCCLALYSLALAGQAEPAYHEKLFFARKNLCDRDRAVLALAVAESRGSPAMIADLLDAVPSPARPERDPFGSDACDVAARLLAWVRFQPKNAMVEKLVGELIRQQKDSHWGTTQGDAWSILALTEYARLVETIQPAEGSLSWEGKPVPYRLNDRTNLFTRVLPVTNAVNASLALFNALSNRVYATVVIEARPDETPEPAQDRGFGLQRRYDRLDDENHPQDLRGLRVGDRVLVTLRLVVRSPARYMVIDDALPSILEAVNPEFNTREGRASGQLSEDGAWWPSDFHELRKDRSLSFANLVGPGEYSWRYVARVRAAGVVTAPSAKAQEMYHPERYGLSGSQTISSEDPP
jgi:uncharacterized protein YfaS (alpha-2-macroglobulin family)